MALKNTFLHPLVESKVCSCGWCLCPNKYVSVCYVVIYEGKYTSSWNEEWELLVSDIHSPNQKVNVISSLNATTFL